MKTIKLNTNINCSSCIALVRPALDNFIGQNWQVDTTNENKVLTANIADNVNVNALVALINDQGFKAEFINA